mmetsp:Transcript_128943/g.321639  ORF Transcript_128943/g.321639 Transcript_128943/m.321639 type:complete len:198 (-) Transcript_128943:295-888(-)
MEIPFLLCAASKSGLAAVAAASALNPAALPAHPHPPVVVSAFVSSGADHSGGEQSAASFGSATTTNGHDGGNDMAGAHSAQGQLSMPPTSPSDFLGSAGEPSTLVASPDTTAVSDPAVVVAASSADAATTSADVASASPVPVVTPFFVKGNATDHAVWDSVNRIPTQFGVDMASIKNLIQESRSTFSEAVQKLAIGR